jgi:kynureninase
MEETFQPDESFARRLDDDDSLGAFRQRFCVPPDTVYLNGNSLGLASHEAGRFLRHRLEEWMRLGVRGWPEGQPPWLTMGERVGALAAELVGARPEEVSFTGTTTSNVHSLLATFFEPVGRRRRILADATAFPSDVYAMRDQLRLRGCDPAHDLVLVPARADGLLDEDDLLAAMDDDVALALLPSVAYRSAQLLDMAQLTAEGHRRGVAVGFDCCHSAGAVPHALHDWNVDFATWCSYKYLNGGPGCSAFLFVHERHFGRRPGITGWFGVDKERQFDLSLEFVPARRAAGWQISSPGILGSAPIEGALGIHQQAGIERIRAKSLRLTAYLQYLADAHLGGASYGVRVVTPRDPRRRGAHVALEHDREAYRISRALRARGIVVDFREPNIIRAAPVALYNGFHDVWSFVHALEDVIRTRSYELFAPTRAVVS